jgi:hypothetical protein
MRNHATDMLDDGESLGHHGSMTAPHGDVERLKAEVARFPSIDRFLRSYQAVNESLERLAASRDLIDNGSRQERERLLKVVSFLEEKRAAEAERAWSLDLDVEAKSALQRLLLRQGIAIDQLKAVLADGRSEGRSD